MAKNTEQDNGQKQMRPQAQRQTRKDIRIAKEQAKKAEKAELKINKKNNKKILKKQEEEKPLFNPFFGYRKRKFPIWQRLVAVISLSAIALVGGAMFGYGVIGSGNPWAVFDWDTWQHILDFLK